MTIEHITIGDLRPRVQYVADGTVRAFAYPFPVFTAADLEVWLGEARAAAGYAVDSAGASTGGTVSFAAPPPAGTRVTLRRRLVIRRLSDFQEGGAFRAKVVNDELDYQTAVLQQLEVDVSRCLRLSPTDPSGASLVLPPPRPGRAIGWNADATGLTDDPADFAGTRADVQAMRDAAEAAAHAAGASAAAAGGSAAAINATMQSVEDAAAVAGSARDMADAAAVDAAAAARAAAASAATVAGEAAATQRWSEDVQTLVWLAGRNAGAVADAGAAAAEARAAAEVAAESALLDRVAADRAADRAATAAGSALAQAVGTGPGQILPGWVSL